jgi:hypothetical protein
VSCARGRAYPVCPIRYGWHRGGWQGRARGYQVGNWCSTRSGRGQPDTPGSATGVSTGIYHVGARPDFPSSRRESLGVLGEKS